MAISVVLSEIQRAVLAAVCDTFAPALEVPDDPTGFYGRSASAMGIPDLVEATLGAQLPEEQLQGLRGLLDALAAQGFVELPQEAREAVLHGFMDADPGALAGLSGLRALTFLLFSDFAVIVTYVHLFTLLMVGPIANSLSKIDPALLEAAVDAGASRWRTMVDIVIPLSKTGIVLGSILVFTQVMGDYFVVRQMSGGQSASIVSMLSTQIQAMEYPPAAANAVVLAVLSSFRNRPVQGRTIAFGEIGLSGEVRPVPNGEERLREAATHGFTRAVVPKANVPKGGRYKDMEVIAVERLADALEQA